MNKENNMNKNMKPNLCTTCKYYIARYIFYGGEDHDTHERGCTILLEIFTGKKKVSQCSKYKKESNSLDMTGIKYEAERG
jgi:hypothetical protein